jgi:hypothetical protein
MEQDENQKNKSATENLAAMADALGSAMSQIFNDPKLREKAADLGKAVKESALTLGDRFKDEEVRAKFREAGKAAQAFGKSVTDMLNEDKPGESKKP